MPKDYASVAGSIGRMLKEVLRSVRREPLPERLQHLLERLEEREIPKIEGQRGSTSRQDSVDQP